MREALSEENDSLNINEIVQILPHRYPFLLVDKIIELSLNKNRIVGRKCVTFNEHFFQGHFPDAAIMPGVLVLEALAQTAGILIYKKGYHAKTAVLLGIEKAKFRKPVVPGDTLRLEVKMLHLNKKAGKIEACAKIRGKVVTEATITFALLDKNELYKL